MLKKIIPEEYQQLKLLGEKSIRLEKITRIYPDKNLFSHVVDKLMKIIMAFRFRKSFDKKLKDGRNLFLHLIKNYNL